MLQAIEAHAGCGGSQRGRERFRDDDFRRGCGSEADGVIRNFNRLSPSQQQDILNFLRSL
jgi:hypothetical protein